jgi:hypothetical protein
MRARRPYISKFVANEGKLPRWTPNKWVNGYTEADTYRGFQRVPAEIMLNFAVHKMIDFPGYCISCGGYRVESRGRVFVTPQWAKHVAEIMHPITNDWDAYADGSWPFPEITVKLFNYIWDVAEVQGAFRKESIRDHDRITIMPEKDW